MGWGARAAQDESQTLSPAFRLGFRWARGRGLTAVEVTVWDFNLDAHEFYGRSGFEGLRRYLRKAP
jgi:GNAT superfamily N-acetyltransferase